jgi:hypothetical protein
MLTVRFSRARVFQVGSRYVASTFDIRQDLGPFVEHACGKETPVTSRSEGCRKLQERVRGWMEPAISWTTCVNPDAIAYTEQSVPDTA